MRKDDKKTAKEKKAAKKNNKENNSQLKKEDNIAKETKNDNKSKINIEDKKEKPKKFRLFKKLEDTDYKNQIEALLFSSGKKLEIDFISQVTKIDKDTILKGLNGLKKEYDGRDSPLMVADEGTSWKIIVKEKYVPIVRKIVADIELSKSIMETLAVIAWKSPILQSEVINIRSSKGYDHINELIESGFVVKEKKGRSFIPKVTNKFYDYFDVEGAQDIRQVFSRIREKPVEKKLDEFSESKSIGGLKVVDAVDESKQKAESEMETERLGHLEVYEEQVKNEKNKEDTEEQESRKEKKDDNTTKDNEDTEEDEQIAKKDDDDLAKKTKRIVDELLKDEKKDKK